MSLLSRFSAPLLRSAALRSRGPALPRRSIISGPPENPVGPGESVVGFLAMFVACLGPAAWVLAHLED
ncbi:COX8A oxidase, partial [Turnix velox]|nr:COX8A oxidase [Turnix velox]